jgi:hypothetical protein
MAIEGEAKENFRANASHKVIPAFEAWKCV